MDNIDSSDTKTIAVQASFEQTQTDAAKPYCEVDPIQTIGDLQKVLQAALQSEVAHGQETCSGSDGCDAEDVEQLMSEREDFSRADLSRVEQALLELFRTEESLTSQQKENHCKPIHKGAGMNGAVAEPTPGSQFVPLGELYDEQFQRKTEPMESVEQFSDDRRLFPRRESASRAILHCCEDEDHSLVQDAHWKFHSSELRGDILDVSMSGVAIEVCKELEQDQRVFLRLLSQRLEQPIDLSGRVVRSIPIEPELWKILCEFDRRLSFEQVNTLGLNLFPSEYV